MDILKDGLKSDGETGSSMEQIPDEYWLRFLLYFFLSVPTIAFGFKTTIKIWRKKNE